MSAMDRNVSVPLHAGDLEDLGEQQLAQVGVVADPQPGRAGRGCRFTTLMVSASGKLLDLAG